MKRIQIVGILLLLCILSAPQIRAQQPITPLPIDAKVRYGTLNNGLTYYIRHNETPKERADFYIAQRVGSILEEENQRGLAHFLEHMAFNGTKHFPNHEIDEYTERIGIRGGENLNAYTSFDETVYMIMNAPVTRESVVDSCLLILHDWSNAILLADTAIEKERGVIREEWRTHQDAQARLWEQQLPKMYPNSRYANRLPIGSIDVINHFKPDELRDYYKKWYRPDLQAIIIVGDIDAEQVEQRIRTTFSDIPAPVNAAKRTRFDVPDNDTPLVSIATDKEASNIILYLFYKHDKMPDELMQTTQGVVYNYIQTVSATMINERFNERLQKANPPFVYAVASDGDYMISKTKAAWMVASLAKEGSIDEALTAMVEETERMKQFGFTPSEYERARINVLKQYESAYNERENQKNDAYTNEYVDHFTNGGAIPGIEMEYTLINQIAPAMTVEAVNQYIQSIITHKNTVISLTAPHKEGVVYPSEQELLDTYYKAKATPVEAYRETLSDEPLLPNLPTPGEIVNSQEDPLFGVTVLTLSNGIRVVLKQTDFKKDEIIMTATSPGGSTLFGDEEINNLKVFNDVIELGGLGNFSSVDLGKVLAGKQVSSTMSLGINDESVNGSATPADLKTLFELIYLGFTAPRTDEEAYASFEHRMKAQLTNRQLNPRVAFTDSITKAVYGHNRRAERIRPEDFDRISYSRIMEMYKERFADASDFVFSFVGNINQDTILPYIRQYLATLPSLKRIEKGNPKNVPALRKGDYVNRFNRTLETPKSSVVNLYSGQMDYTLENILTATILKQILDLVYMEKIRKEESGSYGVQTSIRIAPFPEGETILQAHFDTDPAKREQMNNIVHNELKQIAHAGPLPHDLSKTKENMQKRHNESLQENSYWLNVLDNYYYKGFDAHTHYLSILEKITPEKVEAFTKALLTQGNTIEVVMEP